MSQTRQQSERIQSTTVQSIHNCFDLISVMEDFGGEAGITVIAEETQLSKSSVHKHLTTLCEQGFVVKTGHQYRPSLKFLKIGGKMRAQLPASSQVKKKMQYLAQETNEVAFFHVEENGQSTIIFREAGIDGVSTRSCVGMQTYLHQLAAGKAILSQYSEERVEEIVKQHGLPAATDHTITSYEELQADLERTRERGYALSVEEGTEGLQAVGVPITLPNGEVLGGCAVGGPVHRIKDRAHTDIPKILQSVANEIELNIAHS